MSTSDGVQYFPSGGLKTGLPTAAVVTPTKHNARQNKIYDVIVIGAGYAGLVACRELASRGTLLSLYYCYMLMRSHIQVVMSS